ncbi:hypothetical protein PGT21_008098 [Puccinia graminis f. sp. tritici]|uniref:Uncharacterized protein n=1 Tax=Puccinia graminis f. sp. tritici TaxID=56615 RepID=A0A5B0M3I6_PUCGR|nr:hypothetical protein PGT21_008098 [Puccinia graminis f. sp. tritici]KAA1090089.1 hypothetical protein PGTUg99_035392 [Puccinia graminis f. sp. tritici]
MLLLLILADDLKHLLHSNLADNLKHETLWKTAEVKKPLQKSANVMMGDSETSSMEHAPSHKGHGHGPEATPSAPCTPKTASRHHNHPCPSQCQVGPTQTNCSPGGPPGLGVILASRGGCHWDQPKTQAPQQHHFK